MMEDRMYRVVDSNERLLVALERIANALDRINPPNGWEYKKVRVTKHGEAGIKFDEINSHAIKGWELVYIDAQRGFATMRRPL